jgi:hypothetical protein
MDDIRKDFGDDFTNIWAPLIIMHAFVLFDSASPYSEPHVADSLIRPLCLWVGKDFLPDRIQTGPSSVVAVELMNDYGTVAAIKKISHSWALMTTDDAISRLSMRLFLSVAEAKNIVELCDFVARGLASHQLGAVLEVLSFLTSHADTFVSTEASSDEAAVFVRMMIVLLVDDRTEVISKALDAWRLALASCEDSKLTIIGRALDDEKLVDALARIVVDDSLNRKLLSIRFDRIFSSATVLPKSRLLLRMFRLCKTKLVKEQSFGDVVDRQQLTQDVATPIFWLVLLHLWRDGPSDWVPRILALTDIAFSLGPLEVVHKHLPILRELHLRLVQSLYAQQRRGVADETLRQLCLKCLVRLTGSTVSRSQQHQNVAMLIADTTAIAAVHSVSSKSNRLGTLKQQQLAPGVSIERKLLHFKEQSLSSVGTKPATCRLSTDKGVLERISDLETKLRAFRQRSILSVLVQCTLDELAPRKASTVSAHGVDVESPNFFMHQYVVLHEYLSDAAPPEETSGPSGAAHADVSGSGEPDATQTSTVDVAGAAVVAEPAPEIVNETSVDAEDNGEPADGPPVLKRALRVSNK